MAFLDKTDLKELYEDSKKEAKVWREDYPAFERLADNGLMEGLDPNLPEVNDGSLAAALFKLPKRIVSSTLSGTVKALDRDEAWLSELANMQWQNEIIPHANTQAPFSRKWKDAVRKAATYGSVPLVTLFVEKDGKRRADFIVAQPQDVTLEPGKVSDYDSDAIIWDVYYTRTQLKSMIEEAKAENKESRESDSTSYNKWDIEALRRILKSKGLEERDGDDTPRSQQYKGDVKPKGYKFCIIFQRGIDAPFYMYHKQTDSTVREWSNPDPTGDVPVHFLYCYQDFVNPYGIGIVKLAGGTQNVLDYMRQADVLATQIGIRPPWLIEGDADSADLDSFAYVQDGMIFAGNAKVSRMEMANGIYNQIPARMSMYQASLQKLIPTGDTSSSATDSGDPTQSKTPAGVKLAAANLSIDDEDFKDNLYVTYEAVAKSMINTHFANMEGTDLMKLSDDEREILLKGGMEFPTDEMGEMSNQLEIVWDETRATFSFDVEPEQDKAADDADKLQGLMKIAELVAADPMLDQTLAMAGKKFNKGELYAEIIALTSDNDKIITDISPEDEQAMAEQEGMIDPATGLPMEQPMEQGAEQPMPQEQENPEVMANIQAVMEQYGVDEETALTALAAEAQGFAPEDVVAQIERMKAQQQGMPV